MTKMFRAARFNTGMWLLCSPLLPGPLPRPLLNLAYWCVSGPD